MTVALTHDNSIFSIVAGASPFVQIIMALLLLASFLSWWYIFLKLFAFKKAMKQAEQFEHDFWGGSDLNALFQRATGGRFNLGTLERIFESGFSEYVKLRRQPAANIAGVIEGTRRAMRATYQREMDQLESHLSFLATVGSVSPYVGLLGTVWGIMNSFRGLSSVGQATLAQVAPGIAEALIATAMGLFAAIPAVIAYNRFAQDISRLATRFESFMEELSNILHRQAG